MSLSTTDAYRQFRVPNESGKALVEPPLDQVRSTCGELFCDSVSKASTLEFCNRPFESVRREAREEAVQLASDFTRRYRDVTLPSNISAQTPLVLAGHQPELFHAGVWFKNFLLSSLSQKIGGIAINFLVDNDLCRGSSIRVPSRLEDDSVVATPVHFDEVRDEIPWELRLLNSDSVWQAFPQQVRASLLPEVRPLLDEMWVYARDAIARTGRIGYAIAEARHRFEGDLGLQTLEIPLSRLVSTRAFARFSLQLLSELPRFQLVYNEQREIYRRIHHIRSHAHPVPPLEQKHGWLEAPWWIYRPEAPHRQRLWVRLLDDALMLSDQAGWQETIEGRLDCDNAASQWLEIQADGVCLRPRALLTTMYARLFLADPFVHGIGGGKYDQLTDAIIREHFEITPPEFIVASATLRLPLQYTTPASSLADCRDQLWQLKYHAEQAEVASPELEELKQRKAELLANIPEKGEKWDWHREMTRINRRLAELVASQTEAAKKQLEERSQVEREQRVLASREFSFCLFPREFITQQLLKLAKL